MTAVSRRMYTHARPVCNVEVVGIFFHFGGFRYIQRDTYTDVHVHMVCDSRCYSIVDVATCISTGFFFYGQMLLRSRRPHLHFDGFFTAAL